jgi:hypothetical protein
VLDLAALVKRARLQRVTNRAVELDRLRDMLAGVYEPENGLITPPFAVGSARYDAFRRALRTTSTAVPMVVNKSLAGLDFGAITWSDAETGAARADDVVEKLDLPQLARSLATEYKLGGVAAAIASTPPLDGGGYGDPTITVLAGVNVPYTDPSDAARVSGWFRATQYLHDNGQIRWWVEVYDFLDAERTVHRVWRSLTDPTNLGLLPDHEFESPARPRFALYGLQTDGLPLSPLLAGLPRVLGLFATELRLSTVEELASFPMLFTRGEVEFEQIGPGQALVGGEESEARWLDPGSLEELREQARSKRDGLRELFNLPGGSLGGQTPSGEALQEANRGFLQETRALADVLSSVLSEVASDHLTLYGLPPVKVSVPIDRSYTTGGLLEVVEKGVDLRAVPKSVAARMFQTFIGSHYSDDELQKFLAESEALSTPPAGFLDPRDDPPVEEEEPEAR